VRGDGRVFRPVRKGKRLGVWYYEIRGARPKVGRGFRTRAAALDALKQERGRRSRGEFVPPESERLTVDGILEVYLASLEERQKKSIASVRCRIARLKDALGIIRALDLRTSDVEDYRSKRLRAGRDRATIDREVEVLRAAFRLAVKREQLPRVPFFPMYGVDHVRQGFFERDETEAIVAAMPDETFRDVVRFASLSGWRVGEILPLSWEQVDQRARQIRLGTTKSGRPRTLALAGELWRLILRRWQAREHRTPRGSALSGFVFHRRGGRPISYGSYRDAFAAACEAAGVTGRTTHDFRRTVARDLRRLGISETVCMSVTGHETPSMFRRYAGIIDQREQEAALAAREALLAQEKSKRNIAPLR
jgi:integrase